MTTTITACTGPECTRLAEYADPVRADRIATLCKKQIRRHGRLKPLQARNAGRPCSRTGCDCHQPIPPGYVRCRDCIRALHERTAR